MHIFVVHTVFYIKNEFFVLTKVDLSKEMINIGTLFSC